MKKLFFLIALSLFVEFSFAQTAKYYLVKFTDKNNSEYSVAQPASFLSEKAIERRKKQNIGITISDLPVNSSYVDAINAAGVTVLSRSRWLNAVSVISNDERKIDRIKKLPFVKEVILTADPSAEKISSSKFEEESKVVPSATGAVRASSGLNYGQSFFQVNQLGVDCMHNMGYMGQGMTIAVLDAGFYKADSLPAFDSLRMNNQLLGCRDMVTGDTMVFEDFPHGMNVLSCMGGNLPGQLIGTAPKAKFWLIRTEDAFSETLQEEVNWMVGAEFADSVGADIINSSLGYAKFDSGIGDHYYSDMDGNTTIVTNAADWAASKGIFVSSSAGNSGGPPWYKITAPADADSILTVGAVDSAGIIAGFSGRGLTFDGRIKPNVCARGVKTTIAANTGGVTTSGGTSFSSPLTAGAVACLWQSNPAADVMQLIYAIQQSANFASVPDSIYGYGIPDFCKADSILAYVLSVEAIKDDGNSVNVYPNPFSNSFSISLYSAKKGNILVELYDAAGRKVFVSKAEITANTTNIIRLDLPSGLSKGLYTLRLEISGKVSHQKIVKQ